MIALITDTHIGARSSSSIFREYMKWWYDNLFFPSLKANKVKTIIHLGDFFDNRNSVNLQDIDFVVNWFAPKLIEEGITMHCILGNHDVAFKNTNRVHSMAMLKAAAPKNVYVVEEPLLEEINGQEYALVPWINSSNYDSTMKFLDDVKNKQDVIVAGHFEFKDFKMYANSSLCDHGLDAALFKDFKQVWSGHFHHKSKISNVMYLGSAFHLNWQDHGDARGFHLFEKDNLTFVENEYSLFVQIAFDEETFKAMSDDEYKENFESRFVRLVVDADYNKVSLLDTMAKIRRASPHDLQVINLQMLKEDNASTAEEVEERTSKSTEEYVELYIDERDEYNDPRVKRIMLDLCNRAKEAAMVGE